MIQLSNLLNFKIKNIFNNFRKYQLNLIPSDSFNSDYDIDMDATTFNEFATIVIPVAFSMLQTLSLKENKTTAIFNNPDRFYEHQGVEKLVRYKNMFFVQNKFVCTKIQK